MSEIWENVLAIIASIGGAGVIIIGLSSWLGNLWAHLLLNKQEAKFNKEIEVYKKELLLEIERYKTKAEQYTYISKIQFETEFTIYKELLQSLYDFAVSSTNLYPIIDSLPSDEEMQKAVYKERYEQYCTSYNNFARMLEQYAPFMPQKIYDEFRVVRQKAREIGCLFPELRISNKNFSPSDHEMIMEKYYETQEFDDMVSTLKNTVRDYLSNLRVQE